MSKQDDHYASAVGRKRRRIAFTVVIPTFKSVNAKLFLETIVPECTDLTNVGIEMEYFTEAVDKHLPPGSMGSLVKVEHTQAVSYRDGINYYDLTEVFVDVF